MISKSRVLRASYRLVYVHQISSNPLTIHYGYCSCVYVYSNCLDLLFVSSNLYFKRVCSRNIRHGHAIICDQILNSRTSIDWLFEENSINDLSISLTMKSKLPQYSCNKYTFYRTYLLVSSYPSVLYFECQYQTNMFPVSMQRGRFV